MRHKVKGLQAQWKIRLQVSFGGSQSEGRVSVGWTEWGRYPPGGLSRGSTTSAPDKSAWVGSRPLLERGLGGGQ